MALELTSRGAFRRLSGACALALLTILGAGGCGGVLAREYEYDEQIDLSLDGTAAVYVNASIPALVALRGADLDVNPQARLDRARIRAIYEGPGVRVVAVSSYRRHGRRFVSVRLEVDDIRQLPRLPLFAWSEYRLARADDAYTFVQDVGPAVNRPVGDVGWSGRELVAFRVHLPSRIRFHNALAANFRRGNILVWEQSLSERRNGTPLHMEARMDTRSILNRTLWLFAGTFAAAMAALGFIIWWVGRRGKKMVTA
jgi:hypothetical protein